MAEIGVHPTSWSSWRWTGWNTENMVANPLVTMPEDGDITSISCYFAGHGDSPTYKLAIWNSSGTLLVASAQGTASPGSGTTSGQGWLTQSVTLHVTSGTQLRIGWWRCPGTGAGTCDTEWSLTSSGTHDTVTDTSGNVGSFTGSGSNSGQVGAYATYTPSATSQQIYVDGVQLTTGTYVDGQQVTVFMDGVQLYVPTRRPRRRTGPRPAHVFSRPSRIAA